MTHPPVSMLAAIAYAAGLGGDPTAGQQPTASAGGKLSLAEQAVMNWKAHAGIRKKYGSLAVYAATFGLVENEGASAHQHQPATPSRAMSFDETARSEWDNDPRIRAEFGSITTYSAWRVHAHSKATGISVSQIRAETPNVEAYVKKLESRNTGGGSIDRNAINGYSETWRASADIRAEFSTFEIFAAYMRAKASGVVRP